MARPGAYPSNLGDSLVRIHRAISRALDVVVERSAYFSQNGFVDTAAKDGFVSYARSLNTTIRAHHQAEDELAYPYFQAKIPDAPYGRLARDHQTLGKSIIEADGVINGFVDGGAVGGLSRLHDVALSVRDIWGPHIRVEEEWFSAARLASVMPESEHMRLGKLIMEHNRRHAEPAYLIVPFILYNLSGGDREGMSDDMQAVVTKLLVPVVWRPKWASMKPYLLP